MSVLLSDFPPGPLDYYRKKATFDWKRMKIFLDTEDVVQYENKIFDTLKNHPEFQTESLSSSLDEDRRVTMRRVLALANMEVLPSGRILENMKRASILAKALAKYNPALAGKVNLGEAFANIIRNAGTERHHKILALASTKQIQGSFCMTEIGHGSNARKIRTTATYDKEKQQFVLNTPDFEAAKCWGLNLGQVASYAVVFAQLYVDENHHGLHAFLVPIRNPKTLVPLPGVVVGDMGEKIGFNGFDNGFLIFENFYIPRENLLNKQGDITVDGKYVTSLKNPEDGNNVFMSFMLEERVKSIGTYEGFYTKALTIAIRYAAVRKQFGPENKKEVAILEYQSHQHRLLPYLAASYVVKIFSSYLIEQLHQLTSDSHFGNNKKSLANRITEIHILSSGSKSVSQWLTRDAIQECREACGGHGYLKAAGIGNVRNDHDANYNMDGDNFVLLQQTSNWLIKLWSLIQAGKEIKTPMKSSDFLTDALEILSFRFQAADFNQVFQPETIIAAYQWLVCYLLKETKTKQDSLIKQEGAFWARNNSQVFYAKNLGIAFIQHFFLQRMLVVINEAADFNIKCILLKLFSLYGLWSLEKFLGSLYEGGYFEGAAPARLIHEGILKLCGDLKDDAVSLIDAIAPPDFVLNSVLGMSDGQVYQHLKSVFFRSPYSMSRPSWWQEIVNWNNKPSKL